MTVRLRPNLGKEERKGGREGEREEERRRKKKISRMAIQPGKFAVEIGRAHV